MAKTPPETENETAENEVLREVRRQKALEKQQRSKNARTSGAADGEKKGLDWKAAAGLGIGSAALLAALLYSKGDKK